MFLNPKELASHRLEVLSQPINAMQAVGIGDEAAKDTI
jgi:hypothetical protein